MDLKRMETLIKQYLDEKFKAFGAPRWFAMSELYVFLSWLKDRG